MTNSSNSNSKKTSTKKASSKPIQSKPIQIDNKQIYQWITQLIEISLLLVAFGIVVEILFGSIAPLGSGILTNLVTMLGELGENGFVGLMALGIVIYIFKRARALA